MTRSAVDPGRAGRGAAEDAATAWMGESAFSVKDCYAGTKVGSRGALRMARAEAMLGGGLVPATESMMEA